jgi:molecular chaperone GrpE (heat shock protein)
MPLERRKILKTKVLIRLEVIELRNEGLEKDKILISLVNKVKEDETSFKA